jgi:hypothetical protein
MRSKGVFVVRVSIEGSLGLALVDKHTAEMADKGSR